MDKFLDIISEEMKDRNFDPRNRPRRDTVSRKVMKHFGEGCNPTVVHVTVSTESVSLVATEMGGDPDRPKKDGSDYIGIPKEVDNRERFVLHCIVFNIREQLNDLLDDITIFGDLSNLVVNQDNPFAPYQNTSGQIDEILDGTWHAESMERLRNMEVDPFTDGIDFKVDMILYTDKTGTSMNQRYPLEPVVFTLALIRRRLRNLPKCWRPAGYIPDLDTKSGAERRYINSRNRGAAAQSYHLCLEQVLKGFQIIQDEGITRWGIA